MFTLERSPSYGGVRLKSRVLKGATIESRLYLPDGWNSSTPRKSVSEKNAEADWPDRRPILLLNSIVKRGTQRIINP